MIEAVVCSMVLTNAKAELIADDGDEHTVSTTHYSMSIEDFKEIITLWIHFLKEYPLDGDIVQ